MKKRPCPSKPDIALATTRNFNIPTLLVQTALRSTGSLSGAAKRSRAAHRRLTCLADGFACLAEPEAKQDQGQPDVICL